MLCLRSPRPDEACLVRVVLHRANPRSRSARPQRRPYNQRPSSGGRPSASTNARACGSLATKRPTAALSSRILSRRTLRAASAAISRNSVARPTPRLLASASNVSRASSLRRTEIGGVHGLQSIDVARYRTPVDCRYSRSGFSRNPAGSRFAASAPPAPRASSRPTWSGCRPRPAGCRMPSAT